MMQEEKNRREQDAGEDTVSCEPFLTAPFGLDTANMKRQSQIKSPGILSKALTLLNTIRSESDFARFQVPPVFNMPKSQLLWYGESLYCVGEDLLGKCVEGGSSIERLMAVVAWCLSTVRPPIFAVAPFNPTIGETHHVSIGTLNLLLEQISHHPPVSALHATDETRGIDLFSWQTPIPRFRGTTVEASIEGQRELKLLNHGETYKMNRPKYITRFFPSFVAEWVGDVVISCPESCLEATITFKGQSLLGLGRNRSIKGNVVHSITKKLLYELDGHWDKVVTKKEADTGHVSVLYNASNALTGLKTPYVKDPKGLLPTETSLVWAEVSKAIVNRDWERATEAKTVIEERQRKLQRERKAKGIVWEPKYFHAKRTKERWWECSPKQTSVPPAPIAV